MGKKRTPSTPPGVDPHFIATEVIPGVVRHMVATGKSAEEIEPPRLPDMPPLTPEEIALNEEIRRRLNEMAREMRQQNLNNAIVLAQQAARGVGPLVEHFQELGRRYGHLLTNPPKPKLWVVEGGDNR